MLLLLKAGILICQTCKFGILESFQTDSSIITFVILIIIRDYYFFFDAPGILSFFSLLHICFIPNESVGNTNHHHHNHHHHHFPFYPLNRVVYLVHKNQKRLFWMLSSFLYCRKNVLWFYDQRILFERSESFFFHKQDLFCSRQTH